MTGGSKWPHESFDRNTAIVWVRPQSATEANDLTSKAHWPRGTTGHQVGDDDALAPLLWCESCTPGWRASAFLDRGPLGPAGLPRPLSNPAPLPEARLELVGATLSVRDEGAHGSVPVVAGDVRANCVGLSSVSLVLLPSMPCHQPALALAVWVVSRERDVVVAQPTEPKVASRRDQGT